LAAFLAALGAHAVLLYWLTREPPDSLAGSHGQVLAAVDITMVNSTVLEARPDLRTPPAPASAAPIETAEGTAESTPHPQSAEQKEEAAAEKIALDEPRPDAIEKMPVKAREPRHEQEKEQKEASTAADAAGGAHARGLAPSAAKQSTLAAASPGVVRQYARLVQRALASTRPRGAGVGTVTVRLLVSSTGQLASVEIAKSSGNKQLDDIALAAVRWAKLPIPPPGMTADQLLFDFPIYFR
jgi:protein TonB